MSLNWLLYGAYGYTGELTVRLAVEQGLRPVLAGRDEGKLRAVAEQYGLDSRVCSLDDAPAMDRALAGMAAVLHCAGPFSHTYRKMAEACLRNKCHYLDITGEILVYEKLAARSEEAKRAGIMLMPGVGFDVVPSDCLASYLKSKLPDAHRLTLAFMGLGKVSRGTATTMAENMGRPGAARIDGKITPVPPAWKTREIDFGPRKALCVTIPWGDVSTAYHSTGIPNIEVYTAMPPSALKSLRWSRYIGWILRTSFVQNMVKSRVRAGQPGPTDEQRQKGASLLWGEVSNPSGVVKQARITGPEGYTLTALTSLAIIKKVLDGQFTLGFQTPSLQYGADLILEIPGVVRSDV